MEIVKGKIKEEKQVAISFTENELKTIMYGVGNFRGWAMGDLKILSSIADKVAAVVQEFGEVEDAKPE